MGRQIAHDDLGLIWIPIFSGDTMARFRKGKAFWEREQGRKWVGDSWEFGQRFFLREAKERGPGALKKDWEPRLVEGRASAHRCHGLHDRKWHCLWKVWASIARSRALGPDRLARSQWIAMGCATDGRGFVSTRSFSICGT